MGASCCFQLTGLSWVPRLRRRIFLGLGQVSTGPRLAEQEAEPPLRALSEPLLVLPGETVSVQPVSYNDVTVTCPALLRALCPTAVSPHRDPLRGSAANNPISPGEKLRHTVLAGRAQGTRQGTQVGRGRRAQSRWGRQSGLRDWQPPREASAWDQRLPPGGDVCLRPAPVPSVGACMASPISPNPRHVGPQAASGPLLLLFPLLRCPSTDPRSSPLEIQHFCLCSSTWSGAAL